MNEHSETDLLPLYTRTTPKLESDARHAALHPRQVQVRAGCRFYVRVTSIRTRLLDEDNLCEKYHVDLLRYAGVISGDESGVTQIETTQRKASKGEQERIEIEVYEITQPTTEI